MQTARATQALTAGTPPRAGTTGLLSGRTRHHGRARRHSQLVSFLKKMLPIAAIAIFALFILSGVYSFVPPGQLSMEGVAIENGKLVMEKPVMAGFDKQNRPYNVEAARALQNLKQPGVVELETIDADVPFDADTAANVTARTGVYNSEKESLVLTDNVEITGARGMDISLEDAHIDIKSGTLFSEKPVEVKSEQADITAESVRVENNGERIVFRNRVKMIIRRPIQRGDTPVAQGTSGE